MGVVVLKRWLKVDDVCDVFGVHGVCGVVGCLLTGVFTSAALGDGVCRRYNNDKTSWHSGI